MSNSLLHDRTSEIAVPTLHFGEIFTHMFKEVVIGTSSTSPTEVDFIGVIDMLDKQPIVATNEQIIGHDLNTKANNTYLSLVIRLFNGKLYRFVSPIINGTDAAHSMLINIKGLVKVRISGNAAIYSHKLNNSGYFSKHKHSNEDLIEYFVKDIKITTLVSPLDIVQANNAPVHNYSEQAVHLNYGTSEDLMPKHFFDSVVIQKLIGNNVMSCEIINGVLKAVKKVLSLSADRTHLICDNHEDDKFNHYDQFLNKLPVK